VVPVKNSHDGVCNYVDSMALWNVHGVWNAASDCEGFDLGRRHLVSALFRFMDDRPADPDCGSDITLNITLS